MPSALHNFGTSTLHDFTTSTLHKFMDVLAQWEPVKTHGRADLFYAPQHDSPTRAAPTLYAPGRCSPTRGPSRLPWASVTGPLGPSARGRSLPSSLPSDEHAGKWPISRVFCVYPFGLLNRRSAVRIRPGTLPSSAFALGSPGTSGSPGAPGSPLLRVGRGRSAGRSTTPQSRQPPSPLPRSHARTPGSGG